MKVATAAGGQAHNRQARQSRPQLVCILADDSRSMAGPKARAATEGIQEMLMECQSKGPGGERAYFLFKLIRFDDVATLDMDMTPVREIDPDDIVLKGSGGRTNITQALEILYAGLERYVHGLQQHPERNEHPLPLVLLFSDGHHNVGPGPDGIAQKVKSLSLDGDPVIVATAGVSIGAGDKPDEKMLRSIATDNLYVPITNADVLVDFISAVGSSGASTSEELRTIIESL